MHNTPACVQDPNAIYLCKRVASLQNKMPLASLLCRLLSANGTLRQDLDENKSHLHCGEEHESGSTRASVAYWIQTLHLGLYSTAA